nr:conserved hypothetical protein [Vibrio chagasii]
MFLMCSNSSAQSERLSSSTLKKLLSCDRVSTTPNDAGYACAYGFDCNGSLIVQVHHDSFDELERAIEKKRMPCPFDDLIRNQKDFDYPR